MPISKEKILETRWSLSKEKHMRSLNENPKNDRLAGLRVAITGGTSGLGSALVREFVAGGAAVAFVARGRERVESVAREEGAAGIVGDVANKEDIYPIAMQIVGRLGGLDILINNA